MPRMPASKLTGHLGFWMRVVSNHVSHAFARKLAGKGVSVAEWVIVRSLFDKNPTPPSRLADELSLSRGAITKLADRLIAKGLIVREADAVDGRAQTLKLTSAGRKLVPELVKLADLNDAESFGCLTATKRRTLERLLLELVDRNQITTTPTE
jgi:DNA-binding MarR family transcriptional regulator